MITILPTPVTCHRCLNTNYRSITCLKSNYFLQFWQGANNFVQSIFEFCVKFYQVWLFFSVLFWCCCSANKNNKHVNTKTFAIGTIIWEKFSDRIARCRYFWPWLYIYYSRLLNGSVSKQVTVLPRAWCLQRHTYRWLGKAADPASTLEPPDLWNQPPSRCQTPSAPIRNK